MKERLPDIVLKPRSEGITTMVRDAQKMKAVREWIAANETQYRIDAPRAMYPRVGTITFTALAELIGEPITDLPDPWEGPRIQYVKVGGRAGHRRK